MLIRNCPPLSARKRFRLEKIIKSPETEWQQAHGEVAAGGRGEGESQLSLDQEKNSTSGMLLDMLRRRGSDVVQERVTAADHGEGVSQLPLVPEDKPISGGVTA